MSVNNSNTFPAASPQIDQIAEYRDKLRKSRLEEIDAEVAKQLQEQLQQEEEEAKKANLQQMAEDEKFAQKLAEEDRHQSQDHHQPESLPVSLNDDVANIPEEPLAAASVPPRFISPQQQIDLDEQLARRLQEELELEEEEGVDLMNTPRFEYRVNAGSGHGVPSEDPVILMRQLMPLFASVSPSSHPALVDIHELFASPYSSRRIRFPVSFYQSSGSQHLPSHLRSVLAGTRATSYEDLLELSELIQPVSRGANSATIDSIPTHAYARPKDKPPNEADKCGICLTEYEEVVFASPLNLTLLQGEELRTLPQCMHAFHKECIGTHAVYKWMTFVDHWLKINKVCPVCRAELGFSAGDSQLQ